MNNLTVQDILEYLSDGQDENQTYFKLYKNGRSELSFDSIWTDKFNSVDALTKHVREAEVRWIENEIFELEEKLRNLKARKYKYCTKNQS